MERQQQPRPGLHEFRPGQPTARKSVLGKFPWSQHQPSLITPPKFKVPVHSDPVKHGTFARWVWSAFAYLQMNLLRDCRLRTHQTLSGHTKIFTRSNYQRPNNASHVAAGRTMCHAGTKSARPSINPLPEP